MGPESFHVTQYLQDINNYDDLNPIVSASPKLRAKKSSEQTNLIKIKEAENCSGISVVIDGMRSKKELLRSSPEYGNLVEINRNKSLGSK